MQRIGTKITVTVPEELLKEIEQIAERFQKSKAEVCRNMIETGIDTYKIYEKLGVIKLAEVVRKNKLKRQNTSKE